MSGTAHLQLVYCAIWVGENIPQWGFFTGWFVRSPPLVISTIIVPCSKGDQFRT